MRIDINFLSLAKARRPRASDLLTFFIDFNINLNQEMLLGHNRRPKALPLD